MNYTIYILKDSSTSPSKHIISPGGITVWLAVTSKGSTQPEDTSSDERIASYVLLACNGTLDDLAEKSWKRFKDYITAWSVGSLAEFKRIVQQSARNWSIRAKEKDASAGYGATCTKCGNHNEYAVQSDRFVCSSCKSYQAMYS